MPLCPSYVKLKVVLVALDTKRQSYGIFIIDLLSTMYSLTIATFCTCSSDVLLLMYHQSADQCCNTHYLMLYIHRLVSVSRCQTLVYKYTYVGTSEVTTVQMSSVLTTILLYWKANYLFRSGRFRARPHAVWQRETWHCLEF